MGIEKLRIYERMNHDYVGVDIRNRLLTDESRVQYFRDVTSCLSLCSRQFEDNTDTKYMV